jgi:hypothetical protein
MQSVRAQFGNSAISFASTPLVQPNPTCKSYSPAPPPLPRSSDDLGSDVPMSKSNYTKGCVHICKYK